jgi:hypothetical protein
MTLLIKWLEQSYNPKEENPSASEDFVLHTLTKSSLNFPTFSLTVSL